MLMSFAGVSRPIAFVDCDDLMGPLGRVLNGWHYEACDGEVGDPVITVARDGGKYRLEAPWLDAPFHEPSPVSAVCSLIVDLVQAYVDSNPALLCLHCGAAEFGGRLVVFPSSTRAGKSTLIARIAAAGHTVFADDLLPITGDHEGISLGIAPRLRLPLPDRIAPAFQDFIQQNAGPRDDYHLYVRPPSDSYAPHGKRAPLGAVVMLDRKPKGRAALAPASRGTGLRHLIERNLARNSAAIEIIDRLDALLGGLPCFALTYSDIEQAAEVLEVAFADWKAPSLDRADDPGQGTVSPAGRRKNGSTEAAMKIDEAARYAQHPLVTLRNVDGDLFLVNPTGDGIFHLDPMGAGVWELLRRPTTVAEAVEALHVAFPAPERDQIERDVRALLADLLQNELVQKSSG